MRALALLALPLLLSGCFLAATTATVESGKAIADHRTLGEQMDDATIYSAINRYFLETDANDLAVNVTINVRRGRVMLTGNADNADTPRIATEQAWRAQGVQEVINEVKINPGGKFWNNTNDALIKKNLESRLFMTKDVMMINYSIDIVNNVAYLLGVCDDQAELDRVISVARTTRGVKQVVSYLKLATDPVPTGGYNAAPANYTPVTPATGPASPGFTPEPISTEPAGSAPLPAPVSSSTLPPPSSGSGY